ncbi:protein mei2-like 5 [Phtheirospermum japonicum]|uniref:Protein mei2-like 5 n=1 Tax=Phtheirospermum japonicum TaxID=374723 RepID=A0A830BUW8_9LAMI|nr:protein mei2-like 5 [Phtheirospermum japonicum]
MGNSTWDLFSRSNSCHTSTDASLFSSSLPVLAHEKFNSNGINHELHLDGKEFHDNDDNHHAVESLLPDEDELLAGMVDDLIDGSDEYDLFGSGGGLELESDLQENLIFGVSGLNITDTGVSNGGARLNLTNGVGPVAGEHPLGEHPSRTLFVRNINSNVEDAEIRTLFEENPSDKDINQGTLVAFNLDPSVSNDDLRQIFGAYGEVKEIRETPHKRHHKFIEFYDVRAAEAALKSLNRSDIAGKRIKLEPSRPGGTRRSSISPPVGSSLPGLASLLNQKVGPTGSSHYLERIYANGNSNGRGGIFEQSRSFPDQDLSNQLNGHVSSFSPSSFNAPTSKPLRGPPLVWGDNGFNFLNHHNYHVGSAPSGASLEQKFGYFHASPKGPKASFVGPGYEGLGSSYNDCVFGDGSPVFGVLPARLSPVFLGNSHFNGFVAGSSLEGGLAGRRSRPIETKGIQLENKKQFELDLDKIRSGGDTRTTIMIKNIPNKYTSKMLMVAIDEHFKGTYDFLYLPIDFKNKCNVGYAFINMLSPLHIIPFYEEFNGRKWEKFNSEKVASLAFARIQGKAALVAHFQNSSLMNEDKRCRPILFDLEHTESSDKIDLRAYNLSRMNGSDQKDFPEQTHENMSGDRVEER